VLTITALKDAIDDFQRHRSDSQVNNRNSKVLRQGKLVSERWYKVEGKRGIMQSSTGVSHFMHHPLFFFFVSMQ
jgi:hypothetical protein